MIIATQKIRNTLTYKVLSAFIAFTFSLSVITPPQAYAQTALPLPTLLNLPSPGTMVPVSSGFNPVMIKGITIHPENPLLFDFIVDTGDEELEGSPLKEESEKLIKYFLASLTVPEEEMWVNLSPYEKDRIVPQGFGDTEMGRDLLAQDYLLKQLTASLMYPEDELGKKFWDRVYTKAYEMYGTTEIPMNTFNKIWIVPENATVFEKDASAFVVESHLKVMLEEDYVALQKNFGVEKYGLDNIKKDEAKVISGVSSEIVREVLIPEIEKEVNEGQTFANLRQIFNSMILAVWYKENLKESLLGQVYVDKNKTRGVDTQDKAINQKIYNQYVEAFKTGVYNYIREDYDPATQRTIPRKYFSGGMRFGTFLGGIETIRTLGSLTAAQLRRFYQKGRSKVFKALSLATEVSAGMSVSVAEMAELLEVPTPAIALAQAAASSPLESDEAHRADIEERMLDILEEELGIDRDQFSSDKTFTDLDIDSLGFQELIIVFEEEFSIEISREEADRITEMTKKKAIDFVIDAESKRDFLLRGSSPVGKSEAVLSEKRAQLAKLRGELKGYRTETARLKRGSLNGVDDERITILDQLRVSAEQQKEQLLGEIIQLEESVAAASSPVQTIIPKETQRILDDIGSRMVTTTSGILAADEGSNENFDPKDLKTAKTAEKRLLALGIPAEEINFEKRQDMRRIFLSDPQRLREAGISGVIVHDEHFKYTNEDGTSMVQKLIKEGIVIIYKSDSGLVDKPGGKKGEKISHPDSLKVLPAKLMVAIANGAEATKFRITIPIGEGLPTDENIDELIEVLAQSAVITQKMGMVPIVEPEVLIDGDHIIEKSYYVRTEVNKRLFKRLRELGAYIPGISLKPSFVISGKDAAVRADAKEVGYLTLKSDLESVPEEVVSIEYLSGGQGQKESEDNLQAREWASFFQASKALHELEKERKIDTLLRVLGRLRDKANIRWLDRTTFSYGRGLQAEALKVWGGNNADMGPATEKFFETVARVVAARNGQLGDLLSASSPVEKTIEDFMSGEVMSYGDFDRVVTETPIDELKQLLVGKIISEHLFVPERWLSSIIRDIRVTGEGNIEFKLEYRNGEDIRVETKGASQLLPYIRLGVALKASSVDTPDAELDDGYEEIGGTNINYEREERMMRPLDVSVRLLGTSVLDKPYYIVVSHKGARLERAIKIEGDPGAIEVVFQLLKERPRDDEFVDSGPSQLDNIFHERSREIVISKIAEAINAMSFSASFFPVGYEDALRKARDANVLPFDLGSLSLEEALVVINPLIQGKEGPVPIIVWSIIGAHTDQIDKEILEKVLPEVSAAKASALDFDMLQTIPLQSAEDQIRTALAAASSPVRLRWQRIVPTSFAPVIEKNAGLSLTDILVTRFKGSLPIREIFDNKQTKAVVETSIGQAFGSILFAGEGKKGKEVADANAVEFSGRTLVSFTQDPSQAVVIMADEGERDDAISLKRGRIYWIGYQGGFWDPDPDDFSKSLASEIQRLRLNNISVNYFAGDALEHTNGLAVEEALTEPTNSWALAALFDDAVPGVRRTVWDKFRIAGISFNAPDDAGVEPLDHPSAAIRKVAAARAGVSIDDPRIKEVVADFTNQLTVIVLGSRTKDLAKSDTQSGDSRHAEIINQLKTMQEVYPGLRLHTPGDGSFAPRAMSILGLELDGRHLMVFGRDGATEATITKLVAKLVPGGQFNNRFVSERETALAVSNETAERYTERDMEMFRALGYAADDHRRTYTTRDLVGGGAFAMTAVTGASEELFDSQTFADLMQRVTFNEQEGTATTNTLVVTPDGSIFVLRIIFESQDLAASKDKILRASQEARAYLAASSPVESDEPVEPDEDSIERIIRDAIAEIYDVDSKEVTPDAFFYTYPGADNLRFLELIAALEREFSIEISDEERLGINSPRQAFRFVREAKKRVDSASSSPVGSIEEIVMDILVKDLGFRHQNISSIEAANGDVHFVNDLGASSDDKKELVEALGIKLNVDISDSDAETLNTKGDVVAFIRAINILKESGQLVERRTGSSPVVTRNGGINLNPALLDLQIKRDKNGIPLPVIQQPIGEMHIDGFLPVIINITPINLPQLLGFADGEFPVDTADTDAQTTPLEIGLIDKYRNKYIRQNHDEDIDV